MEVGRVSAVARVLRCPRCPRVSRVSQGVPGCLGCLRVSQDVPRCPRMSQGVWGVWGVLGAQWGTYPHSWEQGDMSRGIRFELSLREKTQVKKPGWAGAAPAGTRKSRGLHQGCPKVRAAAGPRRAAEVHMFPKESGIRVLADGPTTPRARPDGSVCR